MSFLPVLLLSTAMATPQPVLSSIQDGGGSSGLAGARDGVSTSRDFMNQVNVRSRYLLLPDGIMDNWYYGADTETSTGPHPARPSVRAWAVGLEYVVQVEEANGIFYFEYMPVIMEDGYWDDKESGGDPDYNDGDYVVAENFALYTLGANYGFAVPTTPWMSLIFGGGLGVSIRSGELKAWGSTVAGEEGAENTWTAPQHHEAAPADPDEVYDIPKVIPMLDINLGLRFEINETANIRLEGGFHGLFFFGGAAGIVF